MSDVDPPPPPKTSASGYPIGVPEEDPDEVSLVAEPVLEIRIPEALLPDDVPPQPHKTREQILAEEDLTRENLNELLARQIHRTDLKADELARFVEVACKLNGLYGKGDIDLRRLSNEELLEKWKLVAPSIERLGTQIQFHDKGKRPRGRPRKVVLPEDKTYYGDPEFIGRKWAKRKVKPGPSGPEIEAVS